MQCSGTPSSHVSLPSLLKSNVYIWHILGCCHGNGCIDTSIAEQLCSVQKDHKDDGWESKRSVLSIQMFIFVLQLLSSSWKAYSCWISCVEPVLKELCRTIPNILTFNTEHYWTSHKIGSPVTIAASYIASMPLISTIAEQEDLCSVLFTMYF